MVRAKFISRTFSGKSNNLDRWECPNCRAKKNSECRFNLTPKPSGTKHNCRFCKIELELIK